MAKNTVQVSQDSAGSKTVFEGVEQKILISDLAIQIEATQAVNDLYNFKYAEAEKQFRWIKQKYQWHPLPYFLLGLSEWWKIMPQQESEQYDATFTAYMDTAVVKGKKLFKENPEYKIEAAFFLAAAYAFKGRLLSERRSWRKAATAGKNSLKYLNVSKGHEELSPELLFGDALYNYYSVWIPDNYPMLKPILWFFPKGDKELGIAQLTEVANFAFYTRTEAQLFLMRILYNENTDRARALQVSKYLTETYPDNSYFHRYYVQMMYSTGRPEAEKLAEKMLQRVEADQIGYHARTGKYATFFIAEFSRWRAAHDRAKEFYLKTLAYGEEEEGEGSGYYLYAAMHLAKYAHKAGNNEDLKKYKDLVYDNAKKKHPARKQLKDYLKKNKKIKKNKS